MCNVCIYVRIIGGLQCCLEDSVLYSTKQWRKTLANQQKITLAKKTLANLGDQDILAVTWQAVG